MHGNGRNAIASLTLRATLPVLGAAVGFVVGNAFERCPDGGCTIGGTAWGFVVGFGAGVATAIGIDAARLSNKTIPRTDSRSRATLRLQPLLDASSRPSGLALTGTL
jgi:hypothetical protein